MNKTTKILLKSLFTVYVVTLASCSSGDWDAMAGAFDDINADLYRQNAARSSYSSGYSSPSYTSPPIINSYGEDPRYSTSNKRVGSTKKCSHQGCLGYCSREM